MTKKYKVAFFLSHPINYFSDMFRYIEKHSNIIDLHVYYGSDETIKDNFNDGLRGEGKEWDKNLIGGYKYSVLKNHSFKPSVLNGLFGVLNFGIIKELKSNDYDLVITHGWQYASSYLLFITAKLLNIPYGVRGDTPYVTDIIKKRTPFKSIIRDTILKAILNNASAIYYIGEQSKKFYEIFLNKKDNLFFTPYSVNNDFFYNKYVKKDSKKPVKIIFVGILIPLKQVDTIIYAYSKMQHKDMAKLDIIGNGELSVQLNELVKSKDIKGVEFLGFKDHNDLVDIYKDADIIVLASDSEAWGLVLNEAMGSATAVIVSDMVGSKDDLIKENGFIFPVYDSDALSNYLDILTKDRELLEKYKQKSQEIIKDYNYENILKGMEDSIKNIHKNK